ncbi:MAG: trimeric intracellular cation channel family protein [Granulosicoccus sp.]
MWLDFAGVAVFAISGALVASRKCLDPVGFALIATITGIGGGTLRDLLLGQNVFWIYQPSYISLCVALALMVYFVAPHIEYRYRVLLWADAAGLSLFCVLGARLAADAGFSGTIAIVMGLLSATFGGLIRDVLCNEIPLILRNEIYATAALCGAFVYIILESFSLPYASAELGGICACFLVRALGLSRGLSLPSYRPRAGRDYPPDNKPEF